MPFVRLTLATPRPERVAEVRRHYEDLVAYLRDKPGFVDGWVVVGSADTGDVGRMTLWESEEAANHAANDPHAMSLHSELQFDTFGQLWDRSFDAYTP